MGKDGATVTREAEAGGLQVLGASEILSQNTKYQKDWELGLVTHIYNSGTEEAEAGTGVVAIIPVPVIPVAWEAEAGLCLGVQGQHPGCRATLWEHGHCEEAEAGRSGVQG